MSGKKLLSSVMWKLTLPLKCAVYNHYFEAEIFKIFRGACPRPTTTNGPNAYYSSYLAYYSKPFWLGCIEEKNSQWGLFSPNYHYVKVDTHDMNYKGQALTQWINAKWTDYAIFATASHTQFCWLGMVKSWCLTPIKHETSSINITPHIRLL